MSLSRILNDDPPATSTSVPHPSASMPVIDPALVSPTSQIAPRSPPDSRQTQSTEARRGYQTSSYQGTGGWDPYTGEWVPGDIFPLGRGNGDYYPERSQVHSPHETRNAHYRDTEMEGSSRKRRREDDDDDSRSVESRQGRVSLYLPNLMKCALMVSLQHGPPNYPAHLSKVSHSANSPTEGYDLQPKLEEVYQPTEEERRLASSDLEDCEEIWIGELSEYVLETHKRQKQVELWFEASVLVCGFTNFSP